MYIEVIKNKVKLLVEEIQASRMLQLALVCLPMLIWFWWPASSGIISNVTHVNELFISDSKLQEIKKLPDLSILTRTRELPIEKRTGRDLFLFEESKPLLIKFRPTISIPLTREQLESERLTFIRNQEMNNWPSNLRYLSYLDSKSSGRLGAFSRNEDAITIKRGELFNARWWLVRLTENSAEFQNIKFSDLWWKLDAIESQDDDYDRAEFNNF